MLCEKVVAVQKLPENGVVTFTIIVTVYSASTPHDHFDRSLACREWLTNMSSTIFNFNILDVHYYT